MKRNATVKNRDGEKISVYCAHDRLEPIDLLKPNPKNPNKHPINQIDLLAKVIESQGWRAPITVSARSGLIVKGHGRLEAALAIGCDKIPVEYQEYATEADEIADLIADNRLAELSSIDEELEEAHRAFLEEQGFDLELAGFGFFENCDSEQIGGDDDDLVDADIDEISKPKTWISVMANNENAEDIINKLRLEYPDAKFVIAQGQN